MNKIMISTDSCCDEYKTILNDRNIKYIPMVYILDKEYRDNFSTDKEYIDFYNKLREGALPKTSMLNTAELEKYFEKILKENPNSDIIHLTLSSGLSGTYDAAVNAAELTMKKHPNNKVYIVDSISATQGQNLLLYRAYLEREKGKTSDAIFNILQEVKQHIHAWFFIDDLFHLRRGGRISSAAAAIGTLLQTKPIIAIDSMGKLDIRGKSVGTKKTIKMVANKITENCEDPDKLKNITIVSADADSESIEILKKYVSKRAKNAEITVRFIGPVIGSHTGQGALGIVFEGKQKIKL